MRGPLLQSQSVAVRSANCMAVRSLGMMTGRRTASGSAAVMPFG